MWLKKIRKKKLQSVLICLIIGISSLLMCGSMGIIFSLDKPYNVLQEETKAPEVKVFPYYGTPDKAEEWTEKLKSVDGVKKVISLEKHSIGEKITCNGVKIDAFFTFIKYDPDVYTNIRNIKGAIKPNSDSEVVIPQVMAGQFNINLDDEIVITKGDKDYKFKVVGTFADPYSSNLSFQSELLVNKIPDDLDKQIELCVYGKDGVKGSDITEAYLKKYDGILDGSFNTSEACLSNAAITEKVMGAILFSFSAIIFIVCIMMIRYMIKNALIQDTKTIAVYKSIGYKNSDITNLYMKFYLFLVGIGTMAGIFLSPLLSNSFINDIYSNIGENSRVDILVPGLICFLIIMSISFISIYVVINKIKKMKPVMALNGREGDLGVTKKRKRILFDKLSFSPVSMAVRNIERDRKNTVFIVLTCFLCIYLVNFAAAALSIISGMRDTNYYWLGFDKYDISLCAIDKEKFDENCEKIKKDPDVKRVIKDNMEQGVSLKWEEGIGDTAISTKIYETYDDLETTLVEGRNPQSSNEIVIGNLVAKRMNKSVGDYIDIYLTSDKKVSLLIVGLSQGFYNMGREARMLYSCFEENNVPAKLNEASVYLNDGVDKKTFIDKYNDIFNDEVEIFAREDKYKSIFDQIVDPQKAALKPFSILVIIMGGLNVLCILYLKNAGCRKSYGIYKSIGYSANHLIRMNLIYVGIIAAVSIAVTVPIFCLTFPKLMVAELSMFGFKQYKVDIQASYLIVANLLMFVVFILGALLSSRNLRENHIKDLNQE